MGLFDACLLMNLKGNEIRTQLVFKVPSSFGYNDYSAFVERIKLADIFTSVRVRRPVAPGLKNEHAMALIAKCCNTHQPVLTIGHFGYPAVVKQSDQLEILYQSDQLVAVFKPAGLATIPGRAETDSVLERIARQLKLPHTGETDPRIRVVHRLDKETSGVLLFAKDKAAQQFLSHQFQNNTIEKEYLAICVGQATGDEGDINQPIAIDPNCKTRMAISPSQGRPARTLWKVENQFGEFTVVRCFPKTGKTHQIRVHLKSIGLPLAIDPTYNPVRAPAIPGIFLSRFKQDYRPNHGQKERPLIDRLTLHAEKLRFIAPSGEKVEIIAPPPKDMRATMNQLGRHGRR